jgi:hypothetical protein
MLFSWISIVSDLLSSVFYYQHGSRFTKKSILRIEMNGHQPFRISHIKLAIAIPLLYLKPCGLLETIGKPHVGAATQIIKKRIFDCE